MGSETGYIISYVKVCPGAIGHCDILGTPSYSCDSFCKSPCQWRLVPSSGPVMALVNLTVRLELVHRVLKRTSSNTHAFNPIAPISFDERCGELTIDEQPVFGVPIRRRDFTSDSKVIAPRPTIARHLWRGLRAIRRVVPWASSTSLKESQYATTQTSEILMQLTP